MKAVSTPLDKTPAMDTIVSSLVNESRWIFPAACLATGVAFWSAAPFRSPDRSRITGALSLVSAILIATLAVGHQLAVTLKWLNGSLTGSLVFFYGIGIVLGLPAFLLLARAWPVARGTAPNAPRLMALNGAVVASLLVTGPLNLPLAIPALLTMAYIKHRRPSVGWMLLAGVALVFVFLLVGSFSFFLSGQSFESFSGMEGA